MGWALEGVMRGLIGRGIGDCFEARVMHVDRRMRMV